MDPIHFQTSFNQVIESYKRPCMSHSYSQLYANKLNNLEERNKLLNIQPTKAESGRYRKFEQITRLKK